MIFKYIKNKIEDFWFFYLGEKIENIIDEYYMRRPIILTCEICGLQFAPFLRKRIFGKPIGPKSSDWQELKGRRKRFICHRCLCHAECLPEEFLQQVQEYNQKLEIELEEYKTKHPDVEIQYL